MSRPPTIIWKDDKVHMIDQTLLPGELKVLEIDDYKVLAEGIKSLRIRGAPAIGIAAAYGIVLGAKQYENSDIDGFTVHLENVAEYLIATRPTAVNLKWAAERMMNKLKSISSTDLNDIRSTLLAEANKLLEEDIISCKRIGDYGAEILPDTATGLTHCNAGGLATGGYGTALGIIYSALSADKNIKMYVDETRPLLQGARLTTWELQQAGVDTTLITDNMAGHVMSQGKIDFVIVGADRIANNGDVANKIGTYSVAVLANHHNIPFYVAAPISTIDFDAVSGEDIPIEERDPLEVTHGFGVSTAPAGTAVYSPAFDITPNKLVSAIITDKGVFYSPYDNLKDKILDSIK
ncbi:MAG: S-methyl-5-thioribose-1-phosphate isomerase [Candidatus Marinimicrobia bacterium]|nr:S-methyl-5-thioribose-1-phosphate isomerase [Candidatus Neomarinimicrobiota bacterium]